MPLSLTDRTPYSALLFNCSTPVCLPFTVGIDATPIVQLAPGVRTAGQLSEVTINPALVVGGPIVTEFIAARLVTFTVADLLA